MRRATARAGCGSSRSPRRVRALTLAVTLTLNLTLALTLTLTRCVRAGADGRCARGVRQRHAGVQIDR
eukprot:scaffold18364_cov43-Phaeocystis_antarctica.AAC.2